MYLLNDLMNFNKIFSKDVAYDNIKNNKRAGFHPPSRKQIYGKNTGEGQIDHFFFHLTKSNWNDL